MIPESCISSLYWKLRQNSF